MDAATIANAESLLSTGICFGFLLGLFFALLIARTFIGLVDFLDAWFEERLERASDRWRARRFLQSVRVTHEPD